MSDSEHEADISGLVVPDPPPAKTPTASAKAKAKGKGGKGKTPGSLVGRKRKDHPLKEKLAVLNKLSNGSKPADLCREYGISHSTISTWKKERERIQSLADKGIDEKRMRDREPKHPQVVDCLVRWLRDLRANHVKTVPVGTYDLMQRAEM